MAKWEQLIAARERKHLSQVEAARRINVGLATYQRWELGQRKPQPQHMRRLYEVLGIPQEQQEQPSVQSQIMCMRSPIRSLSPPGFKGTNPQMSVIVTMTSHLWSFAFMDHPTGSDKRASLRRAIEEFDVMYARHKNYHTIRREALCSLASLPLITLGLDTPGQVVSEAQYDQAIAQCTASLEACWELRKSDDIGDRFLAARCATMYIPSLMAIAHRVSHRRSEALDLAARYTLVRAFVARHCTNLAEAIQEGRQAVELSKEAEDVSLQMYAYESLAWSYLFAKNYPLALTTMREAETLLLQATSLLKTRPFHLQIQSRVYSSLAIMQARNGQSPEKALGKVIETDPGNISVSFLDFKRSILFLEVGAAYCYQGNQAKAMEWFEKRIDSETLKPRITQSELGRVETLNLMTLTSLRGKHRDMEQTLYWWMNSVQGAIALHSEQRFAEVLANYEFMEIAWPGERRVTDMREYVVHWDEEAL
jgi:tetratricopeptide (TPR) repeat protein/DNA-binding XRE family transcriptional regulator